MSRGTPYQRHLTTSVTTMQSIDLDSLQVAKQRISLFRTDPLKELHNYPARGRPVEAGARPQSVHLRSKQWASRYLAPLDPEGLDSVQSEGCWLVEPVLPARSWHLPGTFLASSGALQYWPLTYGYINPHVARDISNLRTFVEKRQECEPNGAPNFNNVACQGA